jgi:hypothetical protein
VQSAVINLADSDRPERSRRWFLIVRLFFPPPASHCRNPNNAADGPDALNMAAGVDHAVAELRDGSIDIRRAVP